MKHADLHFLIGIILSPAIVAAYPISNYRAHYAKLVMLPQQLCSGARLPFADSSDSSGGLGYRASRCTFPRLVIYP
ncbi:Hypothetical predicted protein [Podarcis lilfordi]|uniref:Uncharacterized protein n=1 Tax=Podarcis lilfordi TaxID=74358 RepID=A0AA35PKY6_9SAUR|nr:Hypothetical predicted protein [Podarcis lilfordi]